MNDERRGLPSASGFERLILCPGSWRMEQGLPETKSEDAESGTKIHAALAGEDVRLNEEEYDTADKCKELADKITDGLVEIQGEGKTRLVERRLWISDELSAKVDLLAYRGTQGLVIDYKTGRNEVTNAVGNYQLMVAAACAAYEFDLERVIVAIIQPWVYPQVSTAVYDLDGIDDARTIIADTLAEIANPNAPLVPGEKQCKYCKAKATCPAAQSEIGKLAVMTLTANNNEVLSPQDMAELLERCSLAGSIIAAIKGKAKAMLEEGADIPGWRLSPGAKRREVTKPDLVFDRAVAIGIPAARFMGCVDVGLGEFEKLVREATGTKGQALKDQVTALLDGAIEVKQSARSLGRAEVTA